MQEKLDEQKESYEFMITMKNEEIANTQLLIDEQAAEFKKKLSEKYSEINYLSGINDKLKEEIGECKSEVWDHKLKLDACDRDIKALHLTLSQEKEQAKEANRRLS